MSAGHKGEALKILGSDGSSATIGRVLPGSRWDFHRIYRSLIDRTYAGLAAYAQRIVAYSKGREEPAQRISCTMVGPPRV